MVEDNQKLEQLGGMDTHYANDLLDGYVIFRLRDEFVGIGLEFVNEVINVDSIRPLPLISTKFEGIYDLRGNIIPILNFEYCVYNNIKINGEADTRERKIVVLNYSDQQFGIYVHEINDIIEFDDEDFENIPEVVESSIPIEYIESMAAKADGVVIKTLELEEILKDKFPYLVINRAVDENSNGKERKGSLMEKNSKITLDAVQSDALREIMNIASGKAVVAMSKLMKEKAKIDINVEYVTIEDIIELSRSNVMDAQEIVVGIRSQMSKDLNGVVFLIFSWKKLNGFLKEVELTQTKIASIKSLEDLDKTTKSSIEEIGNIIISHFSAGISDFLGVDLYHDVPELAIAEYSALIDGEIARLSRDSDQAILMKTLIHTKSEKIDSQIIFIPYQDSIKKFNSMLNVDQVLTGLEKRKKEKSRELAKIERENKAKKAKIAKNAPSTPVNAKIVDDKDERESELLDFDDEDVMQKVTPQKDYVLDKKIETEFNISSDDLDAFRELGNMGAGNAGNALSQILNKKVFLEIPPAKILSIHDLAEKFSAENEKMVGLVGTTEGFFTSNIFLFFQTEHIANLLQEIMGTKNKKSLSKMNDMSQRDQSAVQEICSILMGHYVAAISNFIQKKINPPEYQFFFQQIDTLLTDLEKASKQKDLKAIIVETKVKVEESLEIRGQFILVLSPSIVQKVKNRMDEVWQ